ncbi:PIR protein [Plasmodium ovale]|uniref:PIR Superfamily Protein n=2 Tax=Plasmodium ovale TaxID=36330 RepID=A0A1A8X4U7_PLAOA|nr:PIR Superfamily Protein [Plasmodium ovale curtisi]SBS99200.1 PIR Superfamily Protein [Plasmodium ovale curtisi]SBT85047.1 PIR protein [Plasmodium ovale]
MTEGINENHLPSVKFEKDIKERMNYRTLESYIKNVTTDDEINNWIQNFQSKVETYLSDSSTDSSFDHDKRCKHFNYLISVTISKINSLSDNVVKTNDWSQKIKEWREKLFRSNPSLKCNISNIYNIEKKILSTFCEDSDFIKGKLSDIQNSVQCDNILKNMSTRKGELISLHKRHMRGKRFISIDDNCSTQVLDKIFPSFICKSITRSPPVAAALNERDDPAESSSLEGTLRTKSSVSSRDLSDFRLESLTVTGENEPSSDSSSDNIGLVSLPIFGVLALSFVLYRYTPLVSKFHASFRNQEDISINQDDVSGEQMLSNTSNFKDIYAENMQYNLSYQTL